MTKIPLKKRSKSQFTLYKKQCDILFEIGRGADICIKKEKNKESCYCRAQSFKYPQGKKNILTGKRDFNNVEVKRIIVIQME